MRMNNKVLIVEDSRLNSAILRNSLKTENYKIDIAVNGETAIEKFLELRPKVMLLDYDLPDYTGLYVLHELQETLGDEWTDEYKVIVLTGNSDEDIVTKFIDRNINGYFVKPFNIPLIKDKMRQLMSQ